MSYMYIIQVNVQMDAVQEAELVPTVDVSMDINIYIYMHTLRNSYSTPGSAYKPQHPDQGCYNLFIASC